MAKIIAKNQAEVKQLKTDRLVNKSARVEYEIYQDDYRIPKYRFFKQYKEFVPKDYVKEAENWVPCATCFDNRAQAKKFRVANKLDVLAEVQAERQKGKQGKTPDQLQKPTMFNRLVSCLCGQENKETEKPALKPDDDIDQFVEEDNTDLNAFFVQTTDYKKKKNV